MTEVVPDPQQKEAVIFTLKVSGVELDI